ncbi:hypothetical protein CR513_47324, partial [Mucuna pruriens]
MAEAPSSDRSKPQITESDMEAAQHLIQLSEDSSSDDIAGKRNRSGDEQEVHQRLSDITIANKIREIFREDEVSRPKNQRRYRSLTNIYMTTTPISMLQSSMADEAPSLRTRETQNHDPLADSNDDILVAARKFMQLSEENDDDNDDVSGKRKRASFSNEEEVDQRLPNNETFGNDIEVIARPKKMKKYRSLAIIYLLTTPIIHPGKEKRSKPQITESDMEAAQQLIQLSEDSSSDNIAGKRNRSGDEQEVHQRLTDITIANKIREIFGEDEISRPKKQRRYRSLTNIYMATTPISML